MGGLFSSLRKTDAMVFAQFSGPLIFVPHLKRNNLGSRLTWKHLISKENQRIVQLESPPNFFLLLILFIF